jgi:hypothetical protein
LRLLTIHQQLLEEKSERIFRSAQSLIAEIDGAVGESDKQTLHYVHYLVETAAFYDKYYDISKAQESLDQVRGLSRRQSWDRSYDFLNIFAKKFREKIGVFDPKQSQIIQNCDHNIGFLEKRQFFRRKSRKIVIILK